MLIRYLKQQLALKKHRYGCDFLEPLLHVFCVHYFYKVLFSWNGMKIYKDEKVFKQQSFNKVELSMPFTSFPQVTK